MRSWHFSSVFLLLLQGEMVLCVRLGISWQGAEISFVDAFWQKHADQSKDCLGKNWKSLAWHYWHHSALLTGVSDIPVKTISQFAVIGGEGGWEVFRYLWYFALCCWRPFLEPLVLPQMSQLYETPSMWTWKGKWGGEESTLKVIWESCKSDLGEL